MTKAEAITELKNKILDKRPILGGLFRDHAELSVRDYHETAVKTSKNILPERKQEFINAIKAEVQKHFSPEVAENVGVQLEKEYFISTAEHQGPFTHPFFVHSNLLAGHNNPDNILVLGVGNVSLNNSSYPRGLIYNTADGLTHHLPFFPAHERMGTVFGHRSYDRQDLNRLKLKGKLADLIEEVYGAEAVLEMENYNHQVVRTNERLWQKLFHRGGVKLPRLVTLQLEDIVLQLLRQHHLSADTEIFDLIFNKAIYKLLLEYADGIPGNFSLKEKKGTFMFWQRDSEGKRRQLWLKDGYLAADSGYKIEFNSQGILSAIDKGQLIPNTFLSLLLLSEYYGVKCLGGFSQGTYLTMMHQAYNKIMGRPEKTFDAAHSSGLRSDFVLAHFVSPDGAWHAAGGLDLALHNNPQSYNIFLQNINQLTLEQAMAPLFPELYPILYTEDERHPDLLAVTGADIIDFYGLKQKIRPCIEISND